MIYEVSGLAEAYKYVWGNGIDEALLRFGNGDIWYLDNQLGSVMALTDNNGQIIESYRYDVYGAVTVYDATGQRIDMTNYDNRYLFTGREYNWHTGLYHYRARTYHPYLGRFTSRDPVRVNSHVLMPVPHAMALTSVLSNWYAAFADNPVNFRDAWGTQAEAVAEALAKQVLKQIAKRIGAAAIPFAGWVLLGWTAFKAVRCYISYRGCLERVRQHCAWCAALSQTSTRWTAYDVEKCRRWLYKRCDTGRVLRCIFDTWFGSFEYPVLPSCCEIEAWLMAQN